VSNTVARLPGPRLGRYRGQPEAAHGGRDRRFSPARDLELRDLLGRELQDYLDRHPTAVGVDTDDKDPQRYVDETEADLSAHGDGS
jgi:hypothetical protein